MSDSQPQDNENQEVRDITEGDNEQNNQDVGQISDPTVQTEEGENAGVDQQPEQEQQASANEVETEQPVDETQQEQTDQNTESGEANAEKENLNEQESQEVAAESQEPLETAADGQEPLETAAEGQEPQEIQEPAAEDEEAQEVEEATVKQQERQEVQKEEEQANKANVSAPSAVQPSVAPSSPVKQESGIPEAPPVDGLRTRSDSVESQHDKLPSSAVSLSWSFGMNQKNPVINLTDEHRRMIAYTCSHTGVLYDFANNKQYLLQGHANAISCTCVSADRRWFATGDKGDNSMVIVWDTYTGNPVRTMFDVHPDGGVIAMAMTPDAKYLATISACEPQTLAIWDWTLDSDVALCTAQLDPQYGMQHYIHFNPSDTTQLVTNSDSRCIFYHWNENQLEYFAPVVTDEDFNKQVGRFSQSIFMPQSTIAFTATSVGNLVVWEVNKQIRGGKQKIADKKAIKLLKLQEKGFTVATITDEYIVLGDVLGHIKFFDLKLKLTNWYQDFHLGPINSISFAYFPEFNNPFDPEEGDFPADATIASKPFVLRDFIVGTSNAIIAHVQTDGTDVKIIVRDHDASVFAIATHPSQPFIVTASYSGLVKIWNYVTKEVVQSRKYERGNLIRCCTFDPRGQFLALGFTNGMIRLVDAISLDELLDTPFRFSKDAITHIEFSHNSNYMAAADAEHTMSLFTRQLIDEDSGTQNPYCFVSRYRSHYKTIVDVMFGQQLDSDEPRLISIGEDRHLVEYDLVNSTQDDLRILTSERIEQSAIPLCMAWYPQVTKESFILTGNDQYKLRLYNATTKMCRKTILGPTFGSPIQKLVVLPSSGDEKETRYVAYITTDKIGLHMLPLDGNPHNAMALIAHPQGVTNLVTSHDGQYLFTAGGIDSCVHMWDINPVALHAQSELGGKGLVPFYGLLDGGQEGELFRELEDYFYYAQLRSQGVETMDTRKVDTHIPIEQVPYVMRALGFYPTEQEIDDMVNEIKYSTYVETGEYKTQVDMSDFIKLYVNHRPAFGLEPERLLWAFDKLGAELDQTIDRGELLDLLQNKGEHMTEYELAEYLTTLLGLNVEGGSAEQHEFDATDSGALLDTNLPHKVSAELFADELLRLGLYSNVLPVENEES